MAIPNTTPTPNELFNGEMKKMTDTELRVVLLVTRATLGWEEDKETKMRKKEDWISYFQLKQKTGRGYTALSKAIANCIKNGWIEARDSEGNILDTKAKRIGKKIFYRLGPVFLNKIKTSPESEEVKLTSSESEKVKSTSPESVITESVITESEAYKINSLQNKYFTKIGLDKPTRPKRKEIKFPKEDYDRVIKAYQELRGIELKGYEFLPVQQEIKTMFMSGRTVEEIIGCMEWLAEGSEEWMTNWTIRTVRLKLPFYLKLKVGGEIENIPEVAKKWLK